MFRGAAVDPILIPRGQKRPLLRGRPLDELPLAGLQMLDHGSSSRLSICVGERLEDAFVLGDARDEQRPVVQHDVRNRPCNPLPQGRHRASHLAVLSDHRQGLVELGI